MNFNLTQEEKLLVARVSDYIQKCDKNCKTVFTDFLSEREAAIVCAAVAQAGFSDSTIFFGGFNNAERTVVGFFPQYSIYLEKSELLKEFPIVALKITCSGFKEHTHRDYLGSILALGLERCVIGDIVVGANGYEATVFVLEKMSEFIIDTLKLVGRDGVKIKKCALNEISEITHGVSEIFGTVASLRIDSFVSEILSISRDKAVKLIESGFVSINHIQALSKSEQISAGNIITVRGYGKFKLSQVGDTNKKGRTRFCAEKYV